MPPQYSEPFVSILVLDFKREAETRRCLESVRDLARFPHKVIYLHNGGDVDYPHAFLKEGLVDELIQTRQNTGLGIGTRDLFGAAWSPYSFYLQNDQYLKREVTEEEVRALLSRIGTQVTVPGDDAPRTIASIDVAGGWCGWHTYSERAHFIETNFYRSLEVQGVLGYHGAGPYHEGPWREEQMQKYYRANHLLHYTYEEPFIAYSGESAVRQNADGSVWEMKEETGALRLISGPVTKKAAFPPLSDEQWDEVIATGAWEEWCVAGKFER